MNLHRLDDSTLVKNIQESKCSDSIMELSERHAGLIAQTMKRYACASRCSGIAMQDFLDESEALVYKAAENYDPTKNSKFSTWLSNQVRYYCLNTLSRESRYYSVDRVEFVDTLADQIANDEDREAVQQKEKLEYVVHLLSQIKDERVKTIIKMRYLETDGNRVPFRVIAKKLKMSIPGVINLHDSFIKLATEKKEKLKEQDII